MLKLITIRKKNISHWKQISSESFFIFIRILLFFCKFLRLSILLQRFPPPQTKNFCGHLGFCLITVPFVRSFLVLENMAKLASSEKIVFDQSWFRYFSQNSKRFFMWREVRIGLHDGFFHVIPSLAR